MEAYYILVLRPKDITILERYIAENPDIELFKTLVFTPAQFKLLGEYATEKSNAAIQSIVSNAIFVPAQPADLQTVEV